VGGAASPWPPCIPRATGGFSWKNRERDEEVSQGMYAFYLVQGTEKRISLISKTSWTGQGSTVINLSDSTPTKDGK
jgi:hypothetical protein